ncbi:MAG: DNA gyrase inhibitor YacG [Tatlockia sp.]|jgi:hypothetical protein
MTKKITCPTCDKQDTWHAENSFRPFCSARCKLIDLGEWAKESRKIPGESLPLPLSAVEGEKDSEDFFF